MINIPKLNKRRTPALPNRTVIIKSGGRGINNRVAEGYQAQQQADWLVTSPSDVRYIRNKPDIPSVQPSVDAGNIYVLGADGRPYVPQPSPVNPFTGDPDNLQNILDAFYDVLTGGAVLTSSEFDALGLSAGAFDALGLTASQFDTQNRIALG